MTLRDKLPGIAVIFNAVAVIGLLTYFVAQHWGLIDAIALGVGLVLGALTMPAMGTPFFPSPPRLLGIQAQFMRIYFTISSLALGPNVLYKRANGAYTRVRAAIDRETDTVSFDVDGETHTFGGASHRLIQFGKRPLGLAWSKRHPMYRRIVEQRDVVADGGAAVDMVDMGKLHRMLRGAGDHKAINETVKEARNKHGGGDQGMSQNVLMVAIVLMMLLGFATGMFAV